MFFPRWLNFKKFILLLALFMFSSVLAVSDTSKGSSESSSYAITTDLLIYGLVGSNLLNND